MTVDRSKILAYLDGKMRPKDAEHVADILCRTPSGYKPATIVNMTIDRSTIMNAMAETIPEGTDTIEEIMRQTPAEYQVVDVDGFVTIDHYPVPESDDGPSIAVRSRSLMHRGPDDGPYMIELPAPLFSGGWLSRSLRSQLGPYRSNQFFARCYSLGISKGLGMAAREPVLLAVLLREVYGPAGLKDLADEVVFAQPAYAPFKSTVEPILEEYIY